MTTTDRDQITLPALPAAAPNAQSAHARTREETGHSPPRQGLAEAVRAGLSGPALWAATPQPLAGIWHHHRSSADYYHTALVRWPRLGWGCLHTGLAALLRLLEWATDSPPKLILTAGVIALAVFLL